MIQDYRLLSPAQLEQLEKQTLRMIVQALQEYSREARDIFERTPAESKSEAIVLAEDLVQYALEVAETYPINRRFAGFIDYKRVRWIATPYGIFPQVLLVDAKASTEGNRETLQQSQLGMDAEFVSDGKVVTLKALVPPHMDIRTSTGEVVPAITTSAFVHFHYQELEQEEANPRLSEGDLEKGNGGARFRKLISISALLMPHNRLKPIYNPNPTMTFFGQGKHSPRRDEAPRIRVYFNRFAKMCRWRLQTLAFIRDVEYSDPVWRDVDDQGAATEVRFSFVGR